MNRFLDNIDPSIFTLSAVAIGASLINDFNSFEQNAIGNWFFMVGQYILTNAAQQQLLESRIPGNIFFNNAQNDSNITYDIDLLKQAINKINIELENIKNQKN